MKKYNLIAYSLFLVLSIFFFMQNINSKKTIKIIGDKIDLQINNEHKFRDSVLSIIKNYKKPDIKNINNHYINKYEEKIKVIKYNNVNDNILFFTGKYNNYNK